MIQFDRVTLSFSGHTLFKEASFTLQKGERCGLLGRNGSGKSTVLRLLNDEMEPDKGTISIAKDYRIGYLQQHIKFKEKTLREEAALGLAPDERDQVYKAEKILFGLGFSEEDLDADPRLFSGGFQLRLQLAKVLVSEPDCLLLDEPTNYLDIVSIRWLARFLSGWNGSFILITHDREFMDKVTTHTMGIHREELKKIKGSSLDFFEYILLEEEMHEKTRVKSDKKKAHLQSFVERFGAKASKAAQAQSKMKMIERAPVLEKLNALSELSFAFKEAAFPGKKMLEANHLQFSYTDTPLIEDFSCEILKGERIAIIGKNGRGKSTLLRLLVQDLLPTSGDLKISENTEFGYFGQTHIDRLPSSLTITQAIAEANHSLNFTEVKGIAGLMMFSGDLSDKKISVLSGGEKSRVLLGKIVAKPCNLLLLDEPTHHLDIESIEALIDALEDFSGAVIIVTHSELILRRLELNKIILCEEGKQTLFLGNYDEFLAKEGWGDEKKASPKKSAPSSTSAKPIQAQIVKLEERLVFLEKEPVLNERKQKEKEEIEIRLYALYEQKAQEEC